MLVNEYRYEDDVAAQREEAFNMGAKNKAKEDALAFYKEGISIDVISKCVKIPIEQISEWIKENS